MRTNSYEKIRGKCTVDIAIYLFKNCSNKLSPRASPDVTFSGIADVKATHAYADLQRSGFENCWFLGLAHSQMQLLQETGLWRDHSSEVENVLCIRGDQFNLQLRNPKAEKCLWEDPSGLLPADAESLCQILFYVGRALFTLPTVGGITPPTHIHSVNEIWKWEWGSRGLTNITFNLQLAAQVVKPLPHTTRGSGDASSSPQYPTFMHQSGYEQI